MRIFLEHTFPCTPDQYMAILQTEAFDEMLLRETGVKREVLEQRTEGKVLITKTLCTPDKELPAFIAKAVGSSTLRYDQHTRIDPDAHTLEWRIEPHRIGHKVDIAGSMRIEPHSDGCKRIVDGDVTVKVRLIGRQIEKAIVADVEKNYHRSAGAIRAFILETLAADDA